MRFVSEKALSLHKDYIETERNKVSFYEKTYPDLAGKRIREILRLKCSDKMTVASTMLNIKCHELYFSSFGGQYQGSECIRAGYGSEASFLYELYKYAMAAESKFIFIGSEKGRVGIRSGDEWELLNFKNEPLVIDLCEHSYFLDYGFDKGEYLKRLLPFLNLSKLDKKICCKD